MLIVALLRKAWKAIDRRNSTGAKAQLGGMRHWHRRHTKGEEQTNYDVKPPVHLLCRLASLELKRTRIILHFTRVTLSGSSDPCKGYVLLFLYSYILNSSFFFVSFSFFLYFFFFC